VQDKRHYPDPDRFDLHRNPVDHVAFGYGIHSCAGMGRARLEAQELIGSLLRRAGSIQLAGHPV
jgi:cytochrome P450